jgi:serine/threonine-protein kinase
LAQAATDRVSDAFVRGELARNLGRLFMREGKSKESGEAIAQCLAVWVPALGPDDYAVAGAVTDMGNVALMRGEYEQAIAQYVRSLSTLEKLMGPNSPLLGPNLNNIGEAYGSLGEWDRAALVTERAAKVWREGLGPDHPKVALATMNLARARLYSGDLAQAESLADLALTIWTKALGADHPDVAEALHVQAEVARTRGELDRALSTEERALSIREKSSSPSDAVAQSLVSIGETRLAQKKPSLALPPLERAVTVLVGRQDEDPMPLADARFALARALQPTDAKRANELATKARAVYSAAVGPISLERTAKLDAWEASLR